MRYLLATLLILSLCSPVMAEPPAVFINGQLHNVDLSGTTYYIMKTTKQGGWVIKALDTTNTDQFRVSYSYVDGNTDVAYHWTNRDALSGASAFRVFDEAF